MNMANGFRLKFSGSVLLAVSLLLAVACGTAEAPVPTPTTVPAPTQAAPVPTATATLTATAIPAPKPSSPAPSAQVKRGGVLRDSTASDPSSFDPHLVSIAADIPANGNLYSYLLLNTKGYELVCDLCTTWSLEAGGKDMVFNLVKNAT